MQVLAPTAHSDLLPARPDTLADTSYIFSMTITPSEPRFLQRARAADLGQSASIAGVSPL
jgi:hypothetical protein